MSPERRRELELLRRARDRIDREYAEPLDVAAIAASAFMSSAHFSRRFRATYGETPHAYLMSRRIERSSALLRAGASVTDACTAVGFSSLGSFSSRFRAVMGATPTAYRAALAGRLRALPGCTTKALTRPSRIGEARPRDAA